MNFIQSIQLYVNLNFFSLGVAVLMLGHDPSLLGLSDVSETWSQAAKNICYVTKAVTDNKPSLLS